MFVGQSFNSLNDCSRESMSTSEIIGLQMDAEIIGEKNTGEGEMNGIGISINVIRKKDTLKKGPVGHRFLWDRAGAIGEEIRGSFHVISGGPIIVAKISKFILKNSFCFWKSTVQCFCCAERATRKGRLNHNKMIMLR